MFLHPLSERDRETEIERQRQREVCMEARVCGLVSQNPSSNFALLITTYVSFRKLLNFLSLNVFTGKMMLTVTI